jgi:agmatine deiminase
MKQTPAQLGYRMPAEWEQHAATWVAWPHNREDWPGKFGPIPWVYAEIVRHLSRFEQVNILVSGRTARRRVEKRLRLAGADLARVAFVKCATDRVWVRDSGPSFVVRDSAGDAPVAAIHWKFNAWAKYGNYAADQRVPRTIAGHAGVNRFAPRMAVGEKPARVVLEGGAFDVNGRGTVLTTEECLLSDVQARNPGLARAVLEQVFADWVAARHVIWLGQGIEGDDTHGHVDDLARFVDPSTVVCVSETDRSDPNFARLEDNWKRLEQARDQDGSPLRLVRLPMPRPVVFDGQRLPASYANFYVANGVVLVPTFNDPADREALATLAELFPDREVVGIHALDLVWGLGTIHCLTQQQPAGPAT